MDSARGLSGGRARTDEGRRRLVVGAWSPCAQSTTPWAKDPDPIYIIIVYTKYIYIYIGIIRYLYIATIIITHIYNIIYRRDIYVPYEFFSFSFPRVLPTGRRRKYYYYYYYCFHYILYTYYMTYVYGYYFTTGPTTAPYYFFFGRFAVFFLSPAHPTVNAARTYVGTAGI